MQVLDRAYSTPTTLRLPRVSIAAYTVLLSALLTAFEPTFGVAVREPV
jgi:hypothetical protein